MRVTVLRVLSLLLILAGVLVVAYPKLASLRQQGRQQALLNEWQKGFSAVAPAQKGETVVPPVTASTADGAATALNAAALPIVGTLKIEKIDMELPILKDATVEHLNISISTIEPTGQIGQVGNFAVAGHNSYDYGRNFNRLNELALGDKITVSDGTASYSYTVTEKLYVAPEDTWVLLGNERKNITLVTCYPMQSPTQRLIIKGEIVA